MTSPRDKVVDATLALAASRDFSEATLSDIAHRAGISLADLRDLFPSKGAIIGGFTRRIDRQVLDALAGVNLTEPARDRLQTVLTKRLEALEPYRDAIASIVTWAKADPLILSALNREIVNSMRYMLEAADMESDGPVGALKLQGLALAWSRVIDARMRYQPSARFAAWLFRIAHHLAIDHIRRTHPTVNADEVLVGFPGLPEDDPALALDQAEQLQRLATLVEALPTEQKK